MLLIFRHLHTHTHLNTTYGIHAHAQEKATALKELGEIQKVLRRIPVIELNTPTVVLVGAPNVGKSSIVRAVSTGTPEVGALFHV